MSIEIHAIVKSTTIGSDAIELINNEGDSIGISGEFGDNGISQLVHSPAHWSNKKSLSNRVIGEYSLQSELGNKILRSILRGEYNHVKEILKKDLGINPFYLDSLLQIKISGVTSKYVQNNAVKSRTKKTVKDYLSSIGDIIKSSDDVLLKPKVKKFQTSDDLIKKYKIFGVRYNIPYDNYIMNESTSGFCLYDYINSKYTKISEKVKKSFIKSDGCSIDDIISFTTKYKIKCNIYNIVGRSIYHNDLERNKSYPNFACIISSNHIYPHDGLSKIIKPRLPMTKDNVISDMDEKEYEDHIMRGNDIMININNKITNSKGPIIFKHGQDDIVIERFIDNVMFSGLQGSFNYESEDGMLLVKSINYTHSNCNKHVDNMIEYDMKKAYFNVCHKLINPGFEYPIFTVFDRWEKFDCKDAIIDTNYYSINIASFDKLERLGITNNLRVGFLVKLLITSGFLKLKDIDYVKKPSSVGVWKDILIRLNKLIVNMVRYKLNIRPGVTITESDIVKSGIKKEFVLYNGILGKYNKTQTESIYPLSGEEYDLLNYGYDTPQWNVGKSYLNEDTMEMTFKYDRTSTTTFKNINNTTVYNTIVEYNNYFMIKQIFHVLKACKIMPIKIKVDSITYSKEIELNDKDYFKIRIPEDRVDELVNIQKLDLDIGPIFIIKTPTRSLYDFSDINDKIDIEVDNLKNNISYMGKPGTGKTFTVQNNHEYDHAMTISNVCALNMTTNRIRADTLYSSFKIYDADKWHAAMLNMKGKTVWVDEFSMIQKQIWNFLILLCIKYGAKLIISGDPHQIGPIDGMKLNMNDPNVYKIFGSIVTLDTDYRNDQQIINIRDHLLDLILNNGSRAQMYKLFQDISDYDYDWTKVDRHLVWQHDVRHHINNKIMKIRNLKFNTVKIRPEVSVGMVIGCRITKKSDKIYKGDVYRVVASNDTGYSLYHYSSDSTVQMPTDKIKYFEPAFASTTHSSQGLTINEDCCIHQVKNMIFRDPSILYAAITRNKSREELHLLYTSKGDYPMIPAQSKLYHLSIAEDEEPDIKPQQVKMIK